MWLRRLSRILSLAGLPSIALAIRAREYLRQGEPEARFLPWLVSPGRLALDVGAADGLYSYLLKKHGAHVIAFEPNPLNATLLRRALPDVDVREVALSNTVGRATLRVPLVAGLACNGWGTISDRNWFPELKPERVLDCAVAVTTLDSLGLVDVGFMKVDVEGLELEVLQGARVLLERNRPSLLVEVGDEARGVSPSQVHEFLLGLGYCVVRLEPGGRLRSVSSPLNVHGSTNVIAIPFDDN